MLNLLYRGAWSLAGALAPLTGRTTKLGRALRGRLKGARALADWAALHRDTKRRLVWFHAASVGEAHQAEAVLVRLKAARPDLQIAFTHSSPSAERLAARMGAEVSGYAPADTPAEAARALDALRPAALVFGATDLWPVLVREAARRGVRLALISATLAPTSSRRGTLARALLSPAYRALDVVGAIDRADAEALERLGVAKERIHITGDSRHDAAATRAAGIDRDAAVLRAVRGGASLLVAGSTWKADERVLLPALARARRRAELRAVIAPHEPSAGHLTDLERRIAAELPGAKVVKLSALEAGHPLPPPAWDLCLVDRVGVLADLYASATIAFVGGGFHAAGLHAVIEPAALGVPVLFGPRWQTSRDAGLLLQTGGGASAADADGLARALTGWLENPTARAAAGAAARAVVESGLGASQRSVELLLKLL